MRFHFSRDVFQKVQSSKEKLPTIHYVVDDVRWVQARRLRYFQKYLPQYRFDLMPVDRFLKRWKRGRLREDPVYVGSWRSLHGLWKSRPDLFSLEDCRYLMAGVTSHTNIGGGLDPYQPIGYRTPEEALRLAVDLLSECRVVTANSMILHELLRDHLPGFVYCPNGVDTELFSPPEKKVYHPERIKIGWVGKLRGPKNVQAIETACGVLRQEGFIPELIGVSKQTASKALLSRVEMRDYYRQIDFYLCASWNEGTPNPALEAAACGVPVVTTCVGNMRELIQQGTNGFFIGPTAESIVETFREIRRLDSEAYASMSKSIRQSILTDWTWEKNIQSYVPAFDRLLDGKK